VDEIISALGQTMADLISGFEPSLRQQVIEDLMTEISRFEAEYAGAQDHLKCALDTGGMLAPSPAIVLS
jgi:hypothetical protein